MFQVMPVSCVTGPSTSTLLGGEGPTAQARGAVQGCGTRIVEGLSISTYPPSYRWNQKQSQATVTVMRGCPEKPERGERASEQGTQPGLLFAGLELLEHIQYFVSMSGECTLAQVDFTNVNFPCAMW